MKNSGHDVRLVVDTNALVSGLVWGGVPGRVIDWVQTHRTTLWFSEATLRELAAVLRYEKIERKIRADRQSPEVLMAKLMTRFQLAAVGHIPERIPDEPVDNELVAVAVAAQVDAIITGDRKHLLPLKAVDGIPILTPTQFLRWIQKKG